MADIKTINSVPVAGIKTYDNIPLANVKTINALTMGAAVEGPPIPMDGLGAWYKSDAGIYTNTAAQFVAANTEYLSIPSNSSLVLGSTPWTIGGWYYLDSYPAVASILVGKRVAGPSPSEEYQVFFLANGSLNVNYWTGSGVIYGATATAAVPLGVWTFAVVRYDPASGGTVSIMLNDIAAGGATGQGIPATGTAPLHFGVGYPTDGFWLNGRMQNWFIFGRNLSFAEGTYLYNSGAGRRFEELDSAFKTSLRGWWDLSELSGSRYDRSGGSNTLTDNNTVLTQIALIQNAPVVGGYIARWDDSGPNNLDMVATGGYPTRSPNKNGLSVVRFNGSNSQMVSPAVLGSKLGGPQVQTVFVVQNQFAAQGDVTYSWDSSGAFTNEFAAHLKHSNHYLYFVTGAAGAPADGLTYGTAPEPWVNNWHLIELSRNGLTGVIIADEVSVPLTQTPTGTVNTAPSSPLYLGARGVHGPSEVFNGDLAEVIIYNRYLSDSERTTVREYLKEKWFTAVLPDIAGLKAWYKADEGVYSAGGAYFIPGNFEFLSCPHNASLSLGNIPWTIGGWIYQEAGGGTPQVQLCKFADAGAVEYQIYSQAAGPLISILTGVVEAYTAEPVGSWFFYLASYDGAGTLSLQLNNGTAATAVANPPAGSGNLYLGAYNASGAYVHKGAMQNWFIFGRLLNATERTFLYNGGLGRSYEELDAAFKTDLRAWWPLDEVSGTRKDKHTNANHLTDTNTVGYAAAPVVCPASHNSPVWWWRDWSVTGAPAECLPLGARPLWLTGGANGKPAVRFDGTDDLLVTGQWSVPGLYTCFIVCHHFPGTTNYRIGLCANNSATDQQAHYMGMEPAGEMRSTAWNDADVAFVDTLTGDVSVVHVQKVIRDAASIELFRNGVSNGPLATTGTPRAGMYSVKFGHNYTVPVYGYPWGGDIYEVILYDRVLSPAEQAKVEAYLSAKYGV